MKDLLDLLGCDTWSHRHWKDVTRLRVGQRIAIDLLPRALRTVQVSGDLIAQPVARKELTHMVLPGLQPSLRDRKERAV